MLQKENKQAIAGMPFDAVFWQKAEESRNSCLFWVSSLASRQARDLVLRMYVMYAQRLATLLSQHQFNRQSTGIKRFLAIGFSQ